MGSTSNGKLHRTPKSAVVFPGQGSQRVGMGASAFARFPDLVKIADRVLGYSIVDLCTLDRDRKLAQTQHTQPALFVVNALSYLEWREEAGREPDYFAGHSLGEYAALFAAGAFDFETGVKLVQKRGALMAAAGGGGMAAIIGVSPDRIAEVLASSGLPEIDVANYNSREQTVIAGPKDALARARSAFSGEEGGRFVELNVSAPFHSRYMAPAASQLREFLATFEYAEPRKPVISNCEVAPYDLARTVELLTKQLTQPVRWREVMGYLLDDDPQVEIVELGPGDVLTKLAAQARVQYRGRPRPTVAGTPAPALVSAADGAGSERTSETARRSGGSLSADRLGSEAFRREYGVNLAYIAGGMERGISSEALVVRMANAGLLSFFGAKGLSASRIEAAVRSIQSRIRPGAPFGVNVFGAPAFGAPEAETLAACERLGVSVVEASFYLRPTEALVRYRVRGLSEASSGQITRQHRVVAKVDLPEVAELFMAPPPVEMVSALREKGEIDARQAELARKVPLADDVCILGDSGWYTEQRTGHLYLPSLLATSQRLSQVNRYETQVRVGVGGGIGTAETAAAAFLQGADFVLTGSVNQCAAEAGISEAARDILQEVRLQDMSYAPATDMFELGVRAQVLARGTFFSARSNRLYELYRHCGSLEEIDDSTRRTIQDKYFNASFEAVYADVEHELDASAPAVLGEAKQSPRRRMALTFKWYCERGLRMAQEGVHAERLNFGIHCGPALAAFNQRTQGGGLAQWRERHVDAIAQEIMGGAADFLTRRVFALLETRTEPSSHMNPVRR